MLDDFLGFFSDGWLSPPKKLINKTRPRSWARAIITVLWDIGVLALCVAVVVMGYALFGRG